MIFDFIPADRSFITLYIMDNEFRKFSKRVYITECARFEGYRRMKRRKLSSTVSLALLSLSIIAFNILQLCDGYEKFNQRITAVTIMLSALVLVLSLLVSYLNYSEREMKYYDCGLKLSALCDEIDCILIDPEKKGLNNEELHTLKDKYQRIIGECGINHIAIDHKRAALRIENNVWRSSAKTTPKPEEGDKPDDKGKKHMEWNEVWTYCKAPDIWMDLRSFIYHNATRLKVWIEWNILDVNFLYWLLALGIPILAAWIIFNQDGSPAATSAWRQIIPVIFTI